MLRLRLSMTSYSSSRGAQRRGDLPVYLPETVVFLGFAKTA